MHGLLATSLGVTCAAALTLPLAPPATATPQPPAPVAEAATAAGAARPDPPRAPGAPPRAAAPELPGSTQSLPLAPLARDRALGDAGDQGLPRRDVRHFSLLGVVWDDPGAPLHGRVQVRTRAAGTHAWSGWQDLETHNDDHGADPGTPERTSGHVRAGTAPLWVGDSDGVEVRVHGEDTGRHGSDRQGTDRHGRAGVTRAAHTTPQAPAAVLPRGLRLELIDPGADDTRAAHLSAEAAGTREVRRAALDTEARAASAANADLAPVGALEIPALDRAQTRSELLSLRSGKLTAAQKAKPYIGPRPRIVTRRGWGADEKLREKSFVYTSKVKAAFVHHTASGNTYKCSQAPSLIRGIYRYHVKSMGWRDIGYNFVVDKCGTIYEGRAGGVAKAVLGAHTLGFNTNSMGIAVIGTFGSTKPPAAAVTAIARLTAWKLGLYGGNPKGKTYLKSGGGNLYRKGKNVRLNVISGHRDGFATECPGRQLYGKLGTARSSAARLQGR
ncbi:peptidoglycan recognition protein family protein [Streptomyces galbus]|uniref:N-acetylmuramoyl-L-alanine amidase n=1 Tax=Streptomyces galbus TaxID=33898 RepID=A0A4U5X1Q9_STRGB|nr:peptidoglycan recognition protein [Streptomyces galbus]TKT07206.1 N-acetylmuramoyl-L-alanine amidase [Streptomyces galbus]